MSNVAILKAKVDYHKTWTIITLAATLTTTVGYWVTRNHKEASSSFAVMVIIFFFATLYFMFRYDRLHRGLIDEFRKNSEP